MWSIAERESPSPQFLLQPVATAGSGVTTARGAARDSRSKIESSETKNGDKAPHKIQPCVSPQKKRQCTMKRFSDWARGHKLVLYSSTQRRQPPASGPARTPVQPDAAPNAAVAASLV